MLAYVLPHHSFSRLGGWRSHKCYLIRLLLIPLTSLVGSIYTAWTECRHSLGVFHTPVNRKLGGECIFCNQHASSRNQVLMVIIRHWATAWWCAWAERELDKHQEQPGKGAGATHWREGWFEQSFSNLYFLNPRFTSWLRYILHWTISKSKNWNVRARHWICCWRLWVFIVEVRIQGSSFA